ESIRSFKVGSWKNSFHEIWLILDVSPKYARVSPLNFSGKFKSGCWYFCPTLQPCTIKNAAQRQPIKTLNIIFLFIDDLFFFFRFNFITNLLVQRFENHK